MIKQRARPAQPPVRLGVELIQELQSYRYSHPNDTLEQIHAQFPIVPVAQITKYAPAALRGSKRVLAEYIAKAGKIDFANIPFREIGVHVDAHGAAHQIVSLRRAGLVRYRTGRKQDIAGSNAPAVEKKGFHDIELTTLGKQLVRLGNSPQGGIVEIRPIDPSVLDGDDEDTDDGLDELFTESPEPTPAPAPATAMHIAKPPQTFPLLKALLRRAVLISEATALLSKASELLDQSEATQEAVSILEAIKVIPTYSSLEREYMEYASKHK